MGGGWRVNPGHNDGSRLYMPPRHACTLGTCYSIAVCRHGRYPLTVVHASDAVKQSFVLSCLLVVSYLFRFTFVGLTGAELATIANEAAISAARRGSQTIVGGDFQASNEIGIYYRYKYKTRIGSFSVHRVFCRVVVSHGQAAGRDGRPTLEHLRALAFTKNITTIDTATASVTIGVYHAGRPGGVHVNLEDITTVGPCFESCPEGDSFGDKRRIFIYCDSRRKRNRVHRGMRPISMPGTNRSG